MLSREKIADTLQGAAEVIETHGWTQGSYSDEQGYCALGAVAKYCGADSIDNWRTEMYLAAMQYLNDRTGGIAVFNDMPDRTAGDVIDFLKTEAKDLRNG